MNRQRCAWGKSEIMIAYHDREWGVPVHDDRLWFEHLLLDNAQAGLSWEIILRKREGYWQAFDNFDPRKIAKYDARKIRRLLADPGIVRNRLKVASAVNNARCFLEIQKEHKTFDAFIWQYVPGQVPLVNHWRTGKEIPTRTAASDALSKALKQRGFQFVGSTICYAFMQATGLINDHTTDCFRHQELTARSKNVQNG